MVFLSQILFLSQRGHRVEGGLVEQLFGIAVCRMLSRRTWGGSGWIPDMNGSWHNGVHQKQLEISLILSRRDTSRVWALRVHTGAQYSAAEKQGALPTFWGCGRKHRNLDYITRCLTRPFCQRPCTLVLSGGFYRWGCNQVWHQDMLNLGRIRGHMSPAAPWVGRMPYDFSGGKLMTASWWLSGLSLQFLRYWQIDTHVRGNLVFYFFHMCGRQCGGDIISIRVACSRSGRKVRSVDYKVGASTEPWATPFFSLCGRLILPIAGEVYTGSGTQKLHDDVRWMKLIILWSFGWRPWCQTVS